MEYCGCALLLGSLWLSWINLFFIKLVSESWNTKFDIHSPVAVSTKLYSASTRPPQSPSSPKEQEVKLTKAKPPFGSSSSVNGDFMYSVYIYNHLPNTVNSTPPCLASTFWNSDVELWLYTIAFPAAKASGPIEIQTWEEEDNITCWKWDHNSLTISNYLNRDEPPTY